MIWSMVIYRVVDTTIHFTVSSSITTEQFNNIVRVIRQYKS